VGSRGELFLKHSVVEDIYIMSQKEIGHFTALPKPPCWTKGRGRKRKKRGGRRG